MVMIPSCVSVASIRCRRRPVLALAAALWAASLVTPAHASAVELAGVQVPDTFHVDGKSLVLNGYGLRTLSFLRIKLYVAALYLPQKTYDPQAIFASPGPKVVVLHFIHRGSREQVQSRYREGAEENCGDGSCDRSLQADFDRLVASAPPVEPGDTLAYIVTDKSLRVSFNGRPADTYQSPKLGNMMLAGFIGPHPPTMDLKANLLGIMKP